MMKLNQNGSISIFHVTLLIITAVGLKMHVIIISPLLYTAGRDSWLSLILAFLLSFLWIGLLIYIYKKSQGNHLMKVIENCAGKPIRIIFSILLSIYLIGVGIITTRETLTWTNVSYLRYTPLIIIVIVFLSLCVCGAVTGIRSIAILNFFILSIVILLGIFVSLTNMKHKDFSLLTPVLEHGFQPVIKGMVYPVSAMVELFIFILFQHKIQGKVKYKHLFINSLFLLWLSLGPTIGAIVEFGPIEAKNQRFSAYEQWGIASLGRFAEHLDFLSIYQWLSGAFIRVTLIFILAIELLQPKNNKMKYLTLSLFSIIIFIFVLLPLSDIYYYQLLRKYILPFTSYFLFAIVLLICLILFMKKGSVKHHEKTSL